MSAFGENLRREREMRGVSLAEISSATKISVRMLDAVEIERWDRLPGGVFNSAFVRQYARYLGLDDTEQTAIRLGAYLHDLGKVRVPHEILNKPGPLTRAEFDVVQMHPLWGIELLAAVEFPWDLKPIIRWHHERYDGTGYPDRLHGEAIPVAAQIVGIVDVYDALTTQRSYRKALPHESAMAEIERCRSWWSTKVYDAFLTSVEPAASIAKLR